MGEHVCVRVRACVRVCVCFCIDKNKRAFVCVHVLVCLHMCVSVSVIVGERGHARRCTCMLLE